MTTHTTETTNQAGWIAYDLAYATGGDAAGMKARNAVIRAALNGELIEGPAEHPASFSARSTARMFGVLS